MRPPRIDPHLTSSPITTRSIMSTTEEVCSELDNMDIRDNDSKENCKIILRETKTPQIVEENLKSPLLENSGKNSQQENINKNFLQENRTRSTPTSPSFFRSQSVQSRPRARESPVIRLALFPRLEKCASEPEVWNDQGAARDQPGKVQGEAACPGSRSEGHISNMSDVMGDKVDDAPVDEIDAKTMLSDSPQPPVIGLRPDPPPPLPDEGLIMPRKLPNPCLQSRDHRDLHRELLFNQKAGKNVLNQKSELQRALEKHKESQMKKELEQQKQDTRTPFEKVIEERARRLESLEKSNNEEEECSNNKPEFLQVHAKLRARMDSK